ncbi:unnamed protein product [Lepeophtheirus salmonis]|uniref:(salmon louse) hypothetical protein n=1 Tax=Lepeophtheirus salmonis TaxID=72036 RepID=A0A7R8CP65_LEPSM|nr:unnamed protein product [Lepeophtheirus salmonis]CAF2883300.1 unnamed protein product [Lepeophtheirus salmonis]
MSNLSLNRNTLFPYNEVVERRFELIESLERKVPLYPSRVWSTKPSELEYLFFQEKDNQERKNQAVKRKVQPCTMIGLSVPLLNFNHKKMRPSQSLSMTEQENKHECTIAKKNKESVSFQVPPEEYIVHKEHFINNSLIPPPLIPSSKLEIFHKIENKEHGINFIHQKFQGSYQNVLASGTPAERGIPRREANRRRRRAQKERKFMARGNAGLVNHSQWKHSWKP